jgi:hypothetical protein
MSTISLMRGPAFLCSTAVLTIMGCGTGTSATGTWREPRSANAPYAHVLVVGVSPNSRVRRSFEHQLTDAISTGSTRASASVFVASEIGAGALSPQTVRAMVEKSGADAVLVTRLLGRTVTSGMSQERVDVKAGRTVTVIENPGVTEVYAANYSLTREPGELVAKSDAIIETSVYDVADNGRIVYVITTNTKFEEVDGDAIVDITGNMVDAIAARLRSDRLVD